MTLLTGSINFGFGSTTPNGTIFNIGDDSKHYIVRENSSGGLTYMGCAEDNTFQQVLDRTQWRLDIAANILGVVIGTFYDTMVWQAPGTNRFAVVGFSFKADNSIGRDLAVWQWYTITDSTTIVADASSAGCLSCPAVVHDTTPCVADFQWGNSVVGANLYTAAWMGQTGFSTGDAFLIKLPLTGLIFDTSAGAWNAYHCALPWGLTLYAAGGSRFYTNRNSIISDPNGIGVFHYGTPVDDIGYTQSKLVYCVVNPTTMTLFSGQIDRSSEFGIPFSDEGLNFAGLNAGNPRDYYTSPSITGLSYDEVMFGRTYSDATQTVGIRDFNQSLITRAVTSLGQTIFQGTTETVSASLEQTQFYREAGQLNSVMDDQTKFYFGGFLNPIPASNKLATVHWY